MIRVTDTNKNIEYICSKSEAGRIIGVSYKTILRWSKKTNQETYNHFVVSFAPVFVLKKKLSKRKITINDVLLPRANKTKKAINNISY